ncbi:MAG: hypothetical protein WAU25_06080, partial [Nitrososphaeraceae archaeon]
IGYNYLISLIAFSVAVGRIQVFIQDITAIEYHHNDINHNGMKTDKPKKYPCEPLTACALSEMSNVKSIHQSVDCLTLATTS